MKGKVWNPNIGNEAKKAGTTFKPWQSWNPHGQPLRGISLVNSQLAEEWILPATKQDIEVNYMAMLQLGQEKLTQMAWDKSQPMLIRIIAKNMLWGKGFDIVEKMLDRGIWKAVQKGEFDHTSGGAAISTINVNIIRPEIEQNG